MPETVAVMSEDVEFFLDLTGVADVGKRPLRYFQTSLC